jgi:predicted DCC family thiol-disulfide oxidoreductase YuxK
VVDEQRQGSTSDATPAEVPVLIYDGDCAFCSSSVRFIERRIRRHPPCQPWQWLDLSAYGVTQEECERAVQYIDADGRVHAAERGIARTLIHGGKGWALLGRLMLVPGIRHVAAIVYRWISKNRHRMPGGTPQCSLPAAQRTRTASLEDVESP